MEIKKEDFTLEELEGIVEQLKSIDSNDKTEEEIKDAFNEFDKDKNGYLDRTELRAFLEFTFNKYKLRMPVVDKTVDHVFFQIDKDHNSKIEPDELCTYAQTFLKTLAPVFAKALEERKAAE